MRWRAVAIAPAIAMVVTGVAMSGASGSAAAAPHPVADPAALQETYINYVAPQTEKALQRDRLLKQTSLKAAEEYDRKFAGGYPLAAKALARAERKAIKTGENPRDFKQAPGTQEARLLTILVEFDENESLNWDGVMVPQTVFGDRTCVPAINVPKGPLHNHIPDPALWPSKVGAVDNNSFWVKDFSPEHFDKMLYTDEGITDRVRPDLTGPDGEPGIDISGYTMKNMYEEMSKGAYTVTGAATNWVKVPHGEAYYAADTCTKNEDGSWEAGAEQGNDGHPSNDLGAGQLAIDAVNALAAQQPDFPFAEYDIEDQGDLDGDNNVYEPDGVIDHVVLVHAGEDKSGGGGSEGTYAIWAHSSSVVGGATIPGTTLKVSNYIVQPEDSGVGVFAHEYGHDLGLPDLYDVASGGDSDVDFWDLMSSGSHSGPVFQSMPTHMGLWDKWVLGWADPKTYVPGAAAEAVTLGQSSRTPVGTEDGIKVNLPAKVVTLATPHSGSSMWWTGNDQNWADNRITRSVSVPAGTDVRFWMWNNYVIEKDWDYGFVEVSTDNGATWSELPVKDAAGNTVTTPDGYGDPNGRMADYGGKKYGLTGTTNGWRHDYVDLTPYAGTAVQLRLRYATDEAFVERGWFADDFEVTVAGGTATLVDDVESGEGGWTKTVATFVDGTPLGAGWRIDTGTATKSHYYLAEWRNFDGFDEGLKYAYDTTYSSFGPWKVEKIKYNAPGMLVWYRDTTYGSQNPVLATTYDLPSVGTKGGLLIVDSHFDPLRRSGVAAQRDPSTLNNLPSRPQSSNAAFTTQSTYPFRECLAEVDKKDWSAEYCTDFGPLPGVKSFTDAKGWYPGIEFRGSYYFRDIDASVVLPNGDTEPYTVRVVGKDGKPETRLYGTDLGGGIVLGDGNPTKPLGVELEILKVADDKMDATIWVKPAD